MAILFSFLATTSKKLSDEFPEDVEVLQPAAGDWEKEWTSLTCCLIVNTKTATLWQDSEQIVKQFVKQIVKFLIVNT